MSMEHWWNDTDREDVNTKRKHASGLVLPPQIVYALVARIQAGSWQ